MPIILANSLRVYLASVLRSSLNFRFCLCGNFTDSSTQLWLIFKTLPPITKLLCPTGNCPARNYIISIYVHNFIINWFSTGYKFCTIINVSPNFCKISLTIFIHYFNTVVNEYTASKQDHDTFFNVYVHAQM